jgi:Reverse transcriptase (RNA-dependent DNA polymerase)
MSLADTSLFTKHDTNGTTMILIYIYDIIINDNNQIEIDHIKKNLKGKFEIKYVDNLKYFLEIEIIHSTKGLFICQRKYTLDLLKETGKI